MKLKFTTTTIILLLLACYSDGYCQKNDSAIAKVFVPQDLKTNNKILLVKTNEYKRRKVIECKSQFRKNYKGLFQVVPGNVSMDSAYADLNIYKYVLVIDGALSKEDFNGISNRELFFDQKDSSFTKRGSSLYIFDRSSNHALYESGVQNIHAKSVSGYSMNIGTGSGLGMRKVRSVTTDYDAINYNVVKMYIRVMNNH
ncbi:MAG: hypothetical protein ABI402_03405 [Ferruginibacter sp.]